MPDRLYALLTVYPPALEHSIDRLNDTSLSAAERGKVTEQCLAGIGQLSNAVKDQISYLPAHDQRVYSEVISPVVEWLFHSTTLLVEGELIPRPTPGTDWPIDETSEGS